MAISSELRRDLDTALREARQVGDSPLRADRLAERIVAIVRQLEGAQVSDETRSRMQAALASAERVLRRDDDGHEAARHLQSAVRLVEERPKHPSPFDS